MKHTILALVSLLATTPMMAQYAWQYDAHPGKLDLGEGIRYRVETQGSFSKDKTPLWLNANKHGLSSLDETNGYVRATAIRPLLNDSSRRWGVGYGLDVAAPLHYTSNVVVQQAFVEGRWLHGTLTIGAKEEPMELKNNRLSSGSQTLGINARPVPQVRLALPRYWTIPALGRWLQVKGHIAYGMMTDDSWQHSFTNKQSKYADHVLYHSKAGYLKIGSEDRFIPWSLELGLEQATLFGGTAYVPDGSGGMRVIENDKGISSFWHAFVPAGGDKPSEGTVYRNKEGNVLGSWLVRFNYDGERVAWHLYADKYYEDLSSMFQLDYDGYGEGDEWNTKKKTRFFLYDFKDWMLGAELNLKYGTWLRSVVFEYLYT